MMILMTEVRNFNNNKFLPWRVRGESRRQHFRALISNAQWVKPVVRPKYPNV